MDVAFFECWIQLAPHFSISFLFVYWCFPSTLCLLGMCFLGEALQKGCCWAHVELNEDWTALVLVCFWWLGCWCEMLSVAGKLFGEGDGTCREGSDDGKAVCVCIIVQFFLSICFSLSDHPKDLGKLESLESVECFSWPSYSFQRLRWLLVWRDLFFQC